ncbi:MAG: GIY-YIG nuclease family protein [Bdellovibrionia bacterium]
MLYTPDFSYENPLRRRFDEAFVKNLPQQPGVYFFLDEKKNPLYIGKADQLKKRLSSYWLAKPGKVADHTLEMLELVADVQWEIHHSGKLALRREADLIRAFKPPYNIAGTEPVPYLYIGLKYPNLTNSIASKQARTEHPSRIIDFRLSHHPVEEGYQLFGCYMHRGKVKAGYSALLRLLHVSVIEKDRYNIPSRICHVSPPYLYRSQILSAWSEPLNRFLAGKSRELLKLITFRMLEKENLPRFMIPSLQKDLETTKIFFRSGPSATRKVACALGLKKAIVTPSKMN